MAASRCKVFRVFSRFSLHLFYHTNEAVKDFNVLLTLAVYDGAFPNLLIRHRKFPPNLTQISCTAGQAVQIYCTAPRRKRQPAPEKLSKRILKGGTFAEKSRLTL